MELEAIQINGIRPPSVQPVWTFDGKDLSYEVEQMARLCRTPSPDVIKRQLQRENRPHSTPGIPINLYRPESRAPSRCLQFRKVNQQKSKHETNFEKRLRRFRPPEATEVVVGPGYVLTTKKDRVIATIDTNDMFNTEKYKADKDKTKRQQDDRDELIEQLQQQVNDLTVYLEEEKLNRRYDVKRIAEEFQREIERLKEEHKDHIKAIEADNAEQLKQVEEHHKDAMEIMKNDYEKEAEQTQKELTFLRAAFESYKDTIGEELDTRWKQKELEIKLEFERKAEKLLADQKSVLMSQKNKEFDDLVKEHRRHISTIVEDNRKEMDILLRKFTASAADAEKVKQMVHEVEVVQKENKKLRSELSITKEKLRKSELELDDVKIRLTGFQQHFAEKVAEVDDKYASKVDNLRSDNADLRKQYLKKCDELYKVKSGIDLQQEDALANAKDIMQALILSRARADVSLIAMRDDGLDSAEVPVIQVSKNEPDKNEPATKKNLSSQKSKRPLSAPSTGKETSLAVWQSRGDVENSSSPSSRPCSSLSQSKLMQTGRGSRRQLPSSNNELKKANSSIQVGRVSSVRSSKVIPQNY